MVFRACTSQTWWWITRVLFRMFPSPQWVQVLLTMCCALLMPIASAGHSLNRLVMIQRV